jgi:hypothetical protein
VKVRALVSSIDHGAGKRRVPIGSVGLSPPVARARTSPRGESYGSVGTVFSVPGTHRTPSELPIAIGMDKTGIANTKQSLQFLDCLGDYAARPAGLELALQLNENLISAI